MIEKLAEKAQVSFQLQARPFFLISFELQNGINTFHAMLFLYNLSILSQNLLVVNKT